MKLKLCPIILLAALPCVAFGLAWLQTAQTADNARPFEILSFKLVSYYNSLLQASSPTSADARELPRTPAERVANAQRTTNRRPQERANEIGVPPGAASTIKVISAAEWAYLTIKNTAAKPIKALTWEYAFLRLEQGRLATQAVVISQSEIKPGAKKTLRQPLPPGATRCQVINARAANPPAGESRPFEYVCGRSFADPSLLREKPAPVTLKRIEYADGTLWPYSGLQVCATGSAHNPSVGQVLNLPYAGARTGRLRTCPTTCQVAHKGKSL